jgi:hypothetical protein
MRPSAPMMCVDCGQDATHVPRSYLLDVAGREGGWNGAAWCAEHAMDHADAIPDPAPRMAWAE